MTVLTELIKTKERELSDIDLSELGLGPWSHSKLKVLQQCPLRFYIQYLTKVKLPAAAPNLVTTVGKAVHRILEHIIMGKTIGDSFTVTKKEYEPVLTDEEWEKEVEVTEHNLIEFRQKLDTFERSNPVKRYIQELRIGVTPDFEPTGFFADNVYYRGVIDLGMQLESKDIILIDHKTGAPAQMGIRNFKSQLDTYKVLFHHGIEQVAGAQSGVHFVKDGKIILDDYTTREEIEGKLLRELQFYIVASIDRVKELGYFKHIRGSYCKWCDYNEECKAGNLMDTSLKTKRFFPIKEIK